MEEKYIHTLVKLNSGISSLKTQFSHLLTEFRKVTSFSTEAVLLIYWKSGLQNLLISTICWLNVIDAEQQVECWAAKLSEQFICLHLFSTLYSGGVAFIKATIANLFWLI